MSSWQKIAECPNCGNEGCKRAKFNERMYWCFRDSSKQPFFEGVDPRRSTGNALGGEFEGDPFTKGPPSLLCMEVKKNIQKEIVFPIEHVYEEESFLESGKD